MSFFGFDASLPRDKPHQTQAPGFAQPHDAFAELSGRGIAAEGEVLNFEDTFDDARNDDTFGDGLATQQSVGRDFDFSGKTDSVARAIEEERMRFAASRPAPAVASQPKQISKPLRTGYESYIPQLEADASLWGITPKRSPEPTAHQRQQSQPKPTAPSRKAMTLEEVEAMLRAESKPKHQQIPVPAPAPQQLPSFNFPPSQTPPQFAAQSFQQPMQPLSYAHPPQILQRQHMPVQQPGPAVPRPPGISSHPPQQPQILHRQRAQGEPLSHPPPQTQHNQQAQLQQQEQVQQQQQPQQQAFSHTIPQTRQILQNPNRLSGHGQTMAPPQRQTQPQQDFPRPLQVGPGGPSHSRGPSYNGPVITNPNQILHLNEEDRAAFLQEEARRAKRNHKIHLLSKDNGLMTPQDKNFITRIQLQQLVTATGNVDAAGAEAVLDEDFYYQVYAQIRGGHRRDPHQPASQFAHTYLFQTGGRYGMRRNMRHGDGHIQRMEQQVRRAVEAAKAKPKNKQLVIEGSLGKISFSNAKTPKPLLNIKRNDSELRPQSAQRGPSRGHDSAAADRRTTMRNIENMYDTLLHMENHERQIPAPVTEESDAGLVQAHMEWRETLRSLNSQLWRDLCVLEPIIPNSTSLHPFIAILAHPKGKKAIPRVFRQLEEQQRLTVITMIVVHLDQLDVIAHALPAVDSSTPAPLAVREEVDLFGQVIMPSLFSYVNDASLDIIVGLLGLVVDRTNMALIVRTKVGVNILTMLISRAELLRQATPSMEAGEWEQWVTLYDSLFDATEPTLPYIFPGTVVDADDIHVWQFLAAMGAAASPEQQQRLVIGVKDRVMETVGVSRTLPRELGEQRLGHVNLFMRAIGLDVELLG